jgi:hypothetical protein
MGVICAKPGLIVWRGFGGFVDTGLGDVRVTKSFIYTLLYQSIYGLYYCSHDDVPGRNGISRLFPITGSEWTPFSKRVGGFGAETSAEGAGTLGTHGL